MTKDEITDMWKSSGDLEIIGMPYSKIESFAKLVEERTKAEERELLNTVFWAFQEWKKDRMSDSSFINTVTYLREKSQQ